MLYICTIKVIKVNNEFNNKKQLATQNLLIMQNKHSFQKGLNQVPLGKIPEIKNDIMQALKITSHPAWLRRLKGEVDPKTKEIQNVEEVFKRYGIKEVWGK